MTTTDFIETIFSLPLGKTTVEVKRANRWCSGVMVGRTREAIPKLDVRLEDRSVLCGVPVDQVRMV